jgi:lysophospholipase L1-like esterase
MKRLIIFAAIPAFVFGLFLIYKSTIRPIQVKNQIMESENYRDNLERFRALPIPKDEVILVGNSLMVGVDLSKVHCQGVSKMAINGDMTEGLNHRKSIIVSRRPKTVIIELGINDILAGLGFSLIEFERFFSDSSVQALTTQFAILSLSPTCLESSTFVNADSVNEEILEANLLLVDFCGRKGIVFIDVHSALGGEMLVPSYTSDGVHLNDQGYEHWHHAINSFLHCD